ncbi:MULTISPECIES: YigZ family protein [unclassified Lactobacillus]|uniref:YigZ family protein n=1 Tax=unclassified Lactobacillus TaxID=2620435 RepID=UPI000EFD1572|nr:MULTISPECIES: YigZ family protein [unclassified Lactobacillus]RMC24982.1 YigZ family protein [Lactobacillus sp. ESL0247]RMC29137.1 YigZ family protein [Lactobacillus sp. ESL0246]RMC32740.1 YigZ family protein [Lactobacillus sp. ESL0245]
MMKKENFLTIKENGSHEIIIKKSRFITSFVRVSTIDEAEKAISTISKKYRDATHNTYAYIVDNHVKASDNGEPAGTAGVPELNALQLLKLQNIIVVVTRYFGGIKLGAGGLIRAYSNSVTQAAKKIGIVECIQQQEISFNIAYTYFDKINNYLSKKKISIAKIDYGVDVCLHIFVSEKEQAELLTNLTDQLAGQVQFIKGKTRYIEIPVNTNKEH